MATNYWLGNAAAVAQVATATFGTYDATTTRTITIGGVGIGAQDTGGTLTAALAALAVLLNASAHPYFSYITWTSDATKIYGTADVAGVPFVFVGSVSNGTGTCSNGYTVTTASAGPNDWSTAANWSLAAVPVSTNDVIIKDSSDNIIWGLAQSAVALTSLRIFKSFTGKIGLDWINFATTINGGTTVGRYEYRGTYLQIATSALKIGENYSSQSQNGSGRINIDLGTGTACTVEIFGTAAASSELGRPAVKLIGTNAGHALYVRSAQGGVGVAADIPGETSTFSLISISDVTTTSKVFSGSGLTLTTWTQEGGVNICLAAATITTITVNGGSLTLEGSYAVTTANVNGGTFVPNSTGTITTLNLKGGTTDSTQSNRTRTWTTCNISKLSHLIIDTSFLTITTPVFSTALPLDIQL